MKKKNIKNIMILVILFGAFFAFSNVVQAKGISDFTVLAETGEASCNAVLGDVNNKESTAYFLQQIFNIMKFLTPVLVLAFSVIDFIKAVSSQDKDMIKKATKRTFTRVIVGLIIIVIPIMCDFIFKIMGWYGTCGVN